MLSAVFSSKNIYKSILTFIVAALLSACGGGGGGGTSYPSITYTGVETEAVIDQNNAADYPFVALDGSSGTGSIPLAVNINSTEASGIPDVENIEKATGVVIGLIRSDLGNSVNLVTGVTETQPGSCGGQVTIIDNSTNTSLNGSIEFNNYCESDVFGQITLHGKLILSGTFYLDSSNNPVFQSLALTVQYLKITLFDGVETISEEFSGSMTANNFDPATNEPTDLTITINYKYAGQVFRIVGLQVDESAATISGRFYNPNHGYVEISTDPADSFYYDSFNEQFCNGTLIITGVDTLGNSATITFTDPDTYCTTYNICVDADGAVQCNDNNLWGMEPDPAAWYTPVP